MGGLIRVAGDIARQEGATLTTAEHVLTAKKTARSIEDQVSAEITQHLREYEMTVVEGTRLGRVNGLAVTGNDAGSVLPIMAEVTPDRVRAARSLLPVSPVGVRNHGSRTKSRLPSSRLKTSALS